LSRLPPDRWCAGSPATGAAAVEFVLLVPIMLMVLFGTDHRKPALIS
jgi:hypothetical protein